MFLWLFSCSSVTKSVTGSCGIHERHHFSSERVSVPAGDKHVADSPEAASRRRTSLSYILLALWQAANVTAVRCQPSLMFMTELFSPCTADVIRSLLLLMNNVWAARA